MKNRKDDNVSSYFCCYLAVTLLFLGIIVIVVFSGEICKMYTINLKLRTRSLDLKRGSVSMFELNEKVFKKNGYEIVDPTFPIPKLRMINEPTCEKVFSDWTKIAQQPQPELPPEKIPDGMEMAFLLQNYSNVYYKYSNDKNSPSGEKPKNWDRISELMNWAPDKVAALAYSPDGLSVHYAMQAHRLDNQSGIVIGSMQPWVEVFALRSGARKVLTAEYNALDIQKEFQDRMSAVQPTHFAEHWQKYADSFDFAVSFSSIEHSGMGRYGDPIDPIGDIREMLKVKCLLKRGGLFFVGFPAGPDEIVFNLHRVYGPIRFAMMMTGYELIAVFHGYGPEPRDLTSIKEIFPNRQNTFVLKKL